MQADGRFAAAADRQPIMPHVMAQSQGVNSVKELLARDGFALVPGFVSNKVVAEIIAALDASELPRSRSGGIRNLVSQVPHIAIFAHSAQTGDLVRRALGEDPRLVRSILFDKSPGANWNLGWHQDLTISVQERREVPGYGPWTVKAGVVSVQPPVPVLEAMLTLRLHLDPCHHDNGPLRVVRGSHRHGRLDAEAIDRLVDAHDPVVCTADAGTALLMSPLLLHASSPSQIPTHRRIVHLDFAAAELAPELRWSSTA